MLYYYQNDSMQDVAASVTAMKEVFPKFGSASMGKNKLVGIEDGNHVLLSEYIYTDKERIYSEIVPFLENL